jgi:hypothetical protein
MPDSMQNGTWHQPPSGDGKLVVVATSSLTADGLEKNEALWRGGDEEKNLSGAGHACLDEKSRRGQVFGNAERARIETTTVVNAAYLGARIAGKASGHNKPVVVDIEIEEGEEGEVADVGWHV